MKSDNWKLIKTAPMTGGITVYLYDPYLQKSGKGYFNNYNDSWIIDGYKANPTHWQPLPDPPKFDVIESITIDGIGFKLRRNIPYNNWAIDGTLAYKKELWVDVANKILEADKKGLL